ncbi:MAG: MBOAT family protein [Myxococcales bacterium]|nr:MBOAT family protein [Myxococcales bacterium]
MLFNSWEFLLFFVLVYALYLACQRWVKVQNVLLLVASYVFYGWWNWMFLGLIALSTVIDYVAALKTEAAEREEDRRRWVALSVVSNLSILALFKYFNFFLESLGDLLLLLGLEAALPSLKIVLPVGISFYTFQSMSYTIDVYRGATKACKNPLDFAVYVAFFPQLVAGPIERSSRFLPQVEAPRKLSAPAVEAGIFLIVWGLFKKVVIADNAALIANAVFAEPAAHSGPELLAGALAFTIQIYGDFSGYSDMARGLAMLMGFSLMINFKLPYFAVSPSDFWRRWHVSLSSWLRDYLYIPLGGNRFGTLYTYRNLMLTMVLGGLWHGAAWKFVLWGFYHGALLCLYRLAEGGVAALRSRGKLALDLPRALVMFVFTIGGWIIFRIESLADLGRFMGGLLRGYGQPFPDVMYATLALLWLPVLIMQLAQLVADDLLVALRLPVVLRGLLYGLLLAASMALATGESIEFIYFQF